MSDCYCPKCGEYQLVACEQREELERKLRSLESRLRENDEIAAKQNAHMNDLVRSLEERNRGLVKAVENITHTLCALTDSGWDDEIKKLKEALAQEDCGCKGPGLPHSHSESSVSQAQSTDGGKV